MILIDRPNGTEKIVSIRESCMAYRQPVGMSFVESDLYPFSFLQYLPKPPNNLNSSFSKKSFHKSRISYFSDMQFPQRMVSCVIHNRTFHRGTISPT